jgi:hypothetical protein
MWYIKTSDGTIYGPYDSVGDAEYDADCVDGIVITIPAEFTTLES